MEEIVTGEAVILDLPCARFPTRTLAHLIDLLVQVVAFIVVATIVAAGGSSLNQAAAAAILVTALVLVLVGYPVAFETLSRGRTLGKLALGLRVVADDGGPVRFRQALVRALAGAIECWALAGIPALITSMLSAKGKRLGDVFAGTFVLRERAVRPAASPLSAVGPMWGQFPVSLVEPALRPWSATLDLSGLPEQLAASVASYLSRYWQLDAQVRDQLGWQLATDVTRRVSPPPPPGLPPVAYLHAVLAERRTRELARLRPAQWPAPMPGPAAWGAPPAAAPSPVPPPSAPAQASPADDTGFAPPH